MEDVAVLQGADRDVAQKELGEVLALEIRLANRAFCPPLTSLSRHDTAVLPLFSRIPESDLVLRGFKGHIKRTDCREEKFVSVKVEASERQTKRRKCAKSPPPKV
ncbi:hypothetical protein E2C01_092217 [Portunus trituberculatus]|uniref:Uncharacterized protein n=1 Tax=Portunus trituberculatus TaxID=210409 RepID=A0A5B7JQT3_PORTR|nr:hypothetical protein [Portunus trituberculatus]